MSEPASDAAPEPRGTPIPEGLPHIPCTLRAWAYASALSARYFGPPVYLVGGALRDPDPMVRAEAAESS